MEIFWVTDDLAFGSMPQSDAEWESLRAMGFDYATVLTPQCSLAPFEGEANAGLVIYRHPIEDKPSEALSDDEWGELTWYAYLKTSPGDDILKAVIICQMGLSRSAGVAYAILRCRGHSTEFALTRIHAARPESSPEAWKWQVEGFLARQREKRAMTEVADTGLAPS